MKVPTIRGFGEAMLFLNTAGVVIALVLWCMIEAA